MEYRSEQTIKTKSRFKLGILILHTSQVKIENPFEKYKFPEIILMREHEYF